jgi:hypothetical protein
VNVAVPEESVIVEAEAAADGPEKLTGSPLNGAPSRLVTVAVNASLSPMHVFRVEGEIAILFPDRSAP